MEQSHVSALQLKHQGLEAKIQDELTVPALIPRSCSYSRSES